MPTKEELTKLLIRAVVTFLQVAISVLIAGNLGADGADTVSLLQSAAIGGIGAVLSVLYNYLTNLGDRLEP